MPTGDIDRSLLDRRIHELNRVMDGHAGAIELVGVSESGEVELRFTGMCTGCPYRPLTMAGTIRPVLLAVPGVTKVAAMGSRISAEAEQRLVALLEGSVPARLRIQPSGPLGGGAEQGEHSDDWGRGI